MKITIKHYDMEASWSNDIPNKTIDETSLREAIEAFEGLLIACGYHKDSLNDYIIEKAEELKRDNDN